MPQDTQRTAELLENLLSGEGLTPEMLDALLQDQVIEDLHLEYKHGEVLEKTTEKPSRMIREYVSGFANGAGGVLLVGVDEDNWCVTGCKAPGGGSLTRWASDCVSPIAGYLSPPPVFKKVVHPNGEVLVVAVARSPVLVPCYEGYHRPVYYLRMDDKTLKAPEYLVADLVLRRREHAYLAIPDFGIGENYRKPEREPQGHYDWWFRLQFRVENQGLARAENVRVGVVALSGRRARITTPVGNYLQQHISVVAPDNEKYKGEPPKLHQHVGVLDILESFTVGFCQTDGILSVPLGWANGFYTPYEWKAAVYLTADHTPPVWYQLTLNVNSDLLKHLQSGEAVHSSGPFLRRERVATGRLVVGWVGENI